ncbi:MAG: L,D-transpeptidase [Rhizobiaceae bacterium]|nr:L,D-transpeptidase [Rhizobiaceae bacterium]
MSLFPPDISRRRFLSGASSVAAGLALTACTTARSDTPPQQPRTPRPEVGADYAMMYGAVQDNGYDVPAVPVAKIPPQFLRQVVDDPTGERPGTIVVDTSAHFLYLVREGGYAIRYGVGLGRAGFEWAGRAEIRWKQKWPKWTPPDEMIQRDPSLAKWSADNGGMPPGLNNPLGARALYIFQGDEDTLYRVHGSPEWWSIGKSVSSGCVRMINQDVMDLYDRVPQQSPIMVTSNVTSPMVSGPLNQGVPIDSGVPLGSVLLGRA